MTTDGLFNLPGVNFIYVHKAFVLRTGSVTYDTSDDNGVPVAANPERLPVKAYVCSPSIQAISKIDDIVDAVILIPYGDTPISYDDMIEVPEQDNMLPFLAGKYIISRNGYRPNSLHQRCLVRRPTNGEFRGTNPVIV